jgi:hypothetical protein
LYLTINHPEILPLIRSMAGGIYAPCLDGKHCLIVKCSKEMILAAQLKGEFSIYLAPIKFSKSESGSALITAVFDQGHSPLIITTPLTKDDSMTLELIDLFKLETFHVFFFDHNDREFLSCKARITANSLTNRIRNYRLSKPGREIALIEAANAWFRKTGEDVDNKATKVKLEENLFRDDFVIIDISSATEGVHGAKPVSVSALVREEPGQYQELDIVLALLRTFQSDHIFLNPIKETDGEEFADVLVIGEQTAYIIQAKDSPNTQKTVDSKFDRKRRKSISQLQEGINQLRGAISFVRSEPKLRFALSGSVVEIDLTGKTILGIVIVRELFDDMYCEYSKVAFEHIKKTGVDTVFFDFSEFSKMTLYCKSEAVFLSAARQILQTANRCQKFPRLFYSGKP